MSTAGILRPDEVIFYHPLDNFTEHTLSQVWTGSGGFTPGKIGGEDALSAVTADAPSFGAAVAVSSGSVAGGSTIVPMSATKVVLVYNRGSSYARVATISGTDITLGTETAALLGAYAYADRISSDKFILGGLYNSNHNLYAQIGQVVGTDITLGPITNIQGWPGGKTPKFAFSDSTNGILFTKVVGTNVKTARVLTVSGLTLTFGPAFDVSVQHWNDEAFDVVFCADQRYLFTWRQSDGSGLGHRARIGNISGTDITFGAIAVVQGATRSGSDHFPKHNTVRLEADKVAIHYQIVGSSRVKIATVSGMTITIGPDSGAIYTDDNQPTALAVLSPTLISLSLVKTSGTTRRIKLGTVSGVTVTFGSEATPTPASSQYVDTAGLSADTLLVITSGSGGTEIAVGTVDQEASLTAPTPGAYPAATGYDRVVVAMWAKNVTAGSSTITVQRDYKVDLTATTITFGPASAVWSGAAISDILMGTDAGELNDGLDHLLVLDFEHTGGGNWNLRTSVDGAAFVNQGAGTGTRSTAPGSADPNLAIAAGESGQWIDEAVMWSGDKSSFVRFTSEELANLNDLADTFGEAMDQYESNYGAPICWQATARMPDGTIWQDSGSGACPAVVRVPSGAMDIVVTDGGEMAYPRIQEG